MKKSTVIWIWGSITAIVCALYMVLMHVNDLSVSGLYYFVFLLLFLGLFIGLRQYRDKANGGYLKFGEGYVVSLIMTAMVTVAGVCALAITLKFIPDLGSRILNELQIKLINAGLNEDQVNKMMSYYTNAFTPARMIINSFLGNIFLGAIFGLIATGLNTKKRPLFDDANEMPINESPQA